MRNGGSVNEERYRLWVLVSLSNIIDHLVNITIALRIFSIMHDNTQPDLSCMVSEWLNEEQIEKVKQPVYLFPWYQFDGSVH